jgi:hypothetical protein
MRRAISGSSAGWLRFDGTALEDLNDLWKFDPSALGTRVSGRGWAAAALIRQRRLQSGVYGTLGTAASTNIPGGRRRRRELERCVRQCLALRRIWLRLDRNVGYLNDLWKYTPGENWEQWASGRGWAVAAQSPAFYGTIRSLRYAGNLLPQIPGGRLNAVSWSRCVGQSLALRRDGVDSTGTGDSSTTCGSIPSATGDTGEWTWMGGSTTVGPTTANPESMGRWEQQPPRTIPEDDRMP